MVNFFANLLGVSHIFISSGQLDAVLSIIIGVSRFRSYLTFPPALNEKVRTTL